MTYPSAMRSLYVTFDDATLIIHGSHCRRFSSPMSTAKPIVYIDGVYQKTRVCFLFSKLMNWSAVSSVRAWLTCLLKQSEVVNRKQRQKRDYVGFDFYDHRIETLQHGLSSERKCRVQHTPHSTASVVVSAYPLPPLRGDFSLPLCIIPRPFCIFHEFLIFLWITVRKLLWPQDRDGV